MRPTRPVLELTMQGPTLRLDAPARIALTGDDFGAVRGAGAVPVRAPGRTARRARCAWGAVRGGARAWLAIAGGIDVPEVLGTRSTDLQGGFGGSQGRALRTGDVLPLGAAPSFECLHVGQRAVVDRPGL